MPPDFRTITLEIAIRAVRAYNSGTYRGLKNTTIDQRARELFTAGLGGTYEEVLQQVRFIGVDYGGAAGFKAAYSLAPAIAHDIHLVRDRYASLASAAPPLSQGASPINVVSELYAPFVKPLHGKSNWQVWAAKFWHFLNPDAFPVEDSRVDKFFHLQNQAHSIDKYLELMQRFREFALEHQGWVSGLRATDEGHAWSDLKLWDKVCYGVMELKKVRKVTVSQGKIAGTGAEWNAANNGERERERRQIVHTLHGEDEVRALVKGSFPHLVPLFINTLT